MSAFLKDLKDADVQEQTQIRSHEIAHRKKIGAFYTPIKISTLLSEWAIRSAEDTVLEPCFGGCTFLEAAVARLSALGNRSPATHLYGCDTDPLAFKFLRERVPEAAIGENFFKQDFISFSPEQLPQGAVDVVIGNPPYIRNSNLSDIQRDLIKTCAAQSGIILHGKANLWAHFVIQAMRFVAPTGRMALVLPGSFLYADYSDLVRKHLLNNFASVTAITVAERLFLTEGTEETTVVLLADGYGRKVLNNKLHVGCVDDVNDFSTFMANTTVHSTFPHQPYAGHGMVPGDAGRLHLELSSRPGMMSLRQLASLRIGIVTGNTKFFVKSKSEWNACGIDRRHLHYIFPKTQFVKGILLDASTIEENIRQDVRCLALSPPDVPQAVSLLAYLNNYPEDEKANNATFKKRSHWYQINDSMPIPDAFFVFMSGFGPRIILNESSSTATNALYRVYFHSPIDLTTRKLAAISMQTTFSQLGAEIIGHPRGSGALKLEPSTASRLMLYMPIGHSAEKIARVFAKVHILLKALDFDAARDAADRFLFADPELQKVLAVLKDGLMTVRVRRRRQKRAATL